MKKSIKKLLSSLVPAIILLSLFTGCEPNGPLPDYNSIIENASFQKSAKNDDFEYSVYDTYVEITKYIGSSTDVSIPSEIENLPVYVIGGFGSTNSNESLITSVTIPYGVGIISENAFAYCKRLESVSMPNSVVKIESGAFALCSRLDSIKLGNNLKTIEDNAFLSCSSLKEIKIPDSVTQVGVYAFANCRQLGSVEIGKGITKIDQHTFQECSSILKITIPENVTEIGLDAFASTNLQSITIKGMDVEMRSCGLSSRTNTIVYGYENSTAQAFCERNNMVFKPI